MEAELDSTPFITGELCCFRRALVPALHTGTLADDMDVALQVRRRGYSVVIDNDAIFTEARTGVARKLLQTKSRAPQVESRNCSEAGHVIAPAVRMVRHGRAAFGLVVLPAAAPARPGAVVYGLRRERAVPAMAAATMTLGAAAALIAPSARRQALAQLRMLVFNEAVFIAAWWRVLTGSMDVKWAQERSPAVGGYRLNDRRSAVNTHTLLVQYASGAPLVLDVGCSTGYLAGRLASAGRRWTASSSTRKLPKRHGKYAERSRSARPPTRSCGQGQPDGTTRCCLVTSLSTWSTRRQRCGWLRRHWHPAVVSSCPSRMWRNGGPGPPRLRPLRLCRHWGHGPHAT